MTISSSLNAGVAGLAANANRLAAISDNIANSSTNGYKRVETDFHSMVISAGSGKYSAGGVRSTTLRLIDQSGALVPTSNPTDIAVRGRGFFPVTDLGAIGLDDTGYPMQLATTGSFRLDEDGYLRTSTGIVLMGWPANADGTVPQFPRDTSAGLTPIQVAQNQFVGEPTTVLNLGMNLPATDTVAGSTAAPRELSVEYFDNLGISRTLQLTMTPTVPATGASNEWTIAIRDSAAGNALVGEYTATFNDTQTGGGSLASITQVSGAGLDPATGVGTIAVGGGTGQIEIAFGAPGSSDGLTQLSNIFAPTAITKNGNAVGNMTGVEIDEGGFVVANFDTGASRRLYQVPLIDVGNPNMLIAMDNQTYAPSAGSGGFFMWDAGDGPTGDLVSNALESSTTDVAGELTSLIQTQRAYSSNAKVIQTVDEMLQETTNIKR
jgi:flagellar hook protein FlgE